MASPALTHFLPRFGVAAAVASVLSLTGCQTMNAQDTLPPTSGVQPLKGLAQNVSVRRNAMGMPLIESNSYHDALFALGYVHASDRITQMVTLRLLAEGRLAEMYGADLLDADRYMRAVNLKKMPESCIKPLRRASNASSKSMLAASTLTCSATATSCRRTSRPPVTSRNTGNRKIRH